jgi:hypothetical protein
MRMPPLASDYLSSGRASDGLQRPRLVHKTCRHCDRPVTLRYRPTFTLRPLEHPWPCPHHDCQPEATNRITLPGVLLECWAGHGSKPPDATSAT